LKERKNWAERKFWSLFRLDVKITFLGNFRHHSLGPVRTKIGYLGHLGIWPSEDTPGSSGVAFIRITEFCLGETDLAGQRGYPRALMAGGKYTIRDI
jgi:hypothetical protein